MFDGEDVWSGGEASARDWDSIGVNKIEKVSKAGISKEYDAGSGGRAGGRVMTGGKEGCIRRDKIAAFLQMLVVVA